MASDPTRVALNNLRIMNPPTRQTPCDPRCYDLAKLFLVDTAADNYTDRMALGGRIQETIEAFLEEYEPEAGQ